MVRGGWLWRKSVVSGIVEAEVALGDGFGDGGGLFQGDVASDPVFALAATEMVGQKSH